MRKQSSQESTGSRTVRYTLWILAALGVMVTLFAIPKKPDTDSINDQIRTTRSEIKHADKQARKNSPLNKENKFDLVGAETTATRKLTEGIQLVYGGIQNANQAKQQKPAIANVLGKRFANKYCAVNPQAPIKKNNFTKVYFGSVSDIHSVPVIVYTEYTANFHGKDRPLSTAFRIDYDLAKQKVNTYQEKAFLTTNVMNDEKSNL